MRLEVKSSFPSLRATLLHIRDAECAWQLRISGQPQRWPAEESRGIDTVIKYCTVLHDYVKGLTPEELQASVGGDSITIESDSATELAAEISRELNLAARELDGAIRLEVPDGHQWIARLVEAFPGRIRAIRPDPAHVPD